MSSARKGWILPALCVLLAVCALMSPDGEDRHRQGRYGDFRQGDTISTKAGTAISSRADTTISGRPDLLRIVFRTPCAAAPMTAAATGIPPAIR